MCSIDYRLSPHPDHPTSANDPDHNACHPDHLEDVVDALVWLQSRRAADYILVGHSAGATLAFQACLAQRPGLKHPIAVVGLCGLYDLPALFQNHLDQPVYRAIVEGAFGEDQSVWKSASPTSGRYETMWPGGQCVVLAHSCEDELVERDQFERMHKHLLDQGWAEGPNHRQMHVVEMIGSHDDIWVRGSEGARAIDACVRALVGPKS